MQGLPWRFCFHPKLFARITCVGGVVLLALLVWGYKRKEDAFYEQTEEDGRGGQYNIFLRVKLEGSTKLPLIISRFENFILSICEHSSIELAFHIVVDGPGKSSAMDILQRVQRACKNGLKVEYYDHDDLVQRVLLQITEIKDAILSPEGKKQRGAHFFLPTLMDEFLPQNIGRVISIDVDFFFQSDIKRLFDLFENFKPTAIFGLASEQNMFYRWAFQKYRAQHPNTKLGNPSANGGTGFNGGLIMVDVNNMRNSMLYKQLLRDNAVKRYADKYMYKGQHSQVFFTLLYMEHPELFYVVPCSWNRQMCPTPPHSVYHSCDGPIHAFHGNCNAEMPNERKVAK